MNNTVKLIGFSTEPKTNILLKVYPKYKLYGRIKVKNLAKYKRTKDKKYILYRFCINEYEKPISDYKAILIQDKMKFRELYLAERKARGYKTL